jgi:hypothetical protein
MNFGTSLKERIGQKWKILVLMGIIEGRLSIWFALTQGTVFSSHCG